MHQHHRVEVSYIQSLYSAVVVADVVAVAEVVFYCSFLR